jgi:hypothetical protein
MIMKIVAKFTKMFLLVICFFLISSSQPVGLNASEGQSTQKSITYSPQRTQPVRFDKIKTAGKLFEFEAGSEFNKDFDGDDDWMRGLAITFKNTSNKNIVYVSVLLLFPETEAAGPVMGSPLQFGRFPYKPSIGSYDHLLKPGEEMEIVLTDDEHNNVQSFLKSRSFNKVNRLRLFLESVIFEDDIMWIGGILMRRDPNIPNQWLPIDKQ